VIGKLIASALVGVVGVTGASTYKALTAEAHSVMAKATLSDLVEAVNIQATGDSITSVACANAECTLATSNLGPLDVTLPAGSSIRWSGDTSSGFMVSVTQAGQTQTFNSVTQTTTASSS